MENTSLYPVAIIGAGPSGLSLAIHLKKLGIEAIVLEKGYEAGFSWGAMPDHLHLISLWHSNYLLPDDHQKADKYKDHSAQEFKNYLTGLVSEHNLNIKYNFKVDSITTENNVFVLSNGHESFSAHFAVDCSGYFSHPWIPNYQTIGKTPLMIHFNDFKNGEQIRQYKRICIVGKRLSAGQLITELVESDPKKQIFLSIRSKLKFSPPMSILNILLRKLHWFEWLPLRMKIKKGPDIPMHSSVKKYFKNVQIRGDIKKIENENVHFTDGVEQVDAIIFATGYRRSHDKMKDDFESAERPGYFYLGLDGQRTFTSRFLRGIREDAPHLAKLIFGKLACKNNCQ